MARKYTIRSKEEKLAIPAELWYMLVLQGGVRMKNVLLKGRYAQFQFTIQSIHQNKITTKTSTQSLVGGQ